MAFGIASAGAARFFGGGLAELGVTFLLSVGAWMLGRLLTRRADTVDLFEPVAAFLVGEVRHPYLVELLRQRSRPVEKVEMQGKLALPGAELRSLSKRPRPSA